MFNYTIHTIELIRQNWVLKNNLRTISNLGPTQKYEKKVQNFV